MYLWKEQILQPLLSYLFGLLYDRKGYRVRYTPASSDFGADLLLKKKGVRTVVQAKCYKNAVYSA